MGDLRDDFPFLHKGTAKVFLELVINNACRFTDLPTFKELVNPSDENSEYTLSILEDFL